MRVAFLLSVVCVMQTSLAFDKVVTETQGHVGTCYLIGSAIAGFQLPEAPLIALEARIYLGKLPQDLNEYPPLRPKVYTRFDGFASARQNQHSLEVGEGWTLLLVEFLPPASKWLTFRLDGGLNSGLFMQPAKALHNWFYYVEISYIYCPSPSFYIPLNPTGWFNTSLTCTSPVSLSNTADFPVKEPTVIPASVSIPEQTGRITITITASAAIELIASPDNYLNMPVSSLAEYAGEVYYWNTAGVADIADPRPGMWYLVFRVVNPGDFSYELETSPCFLTGNQSLCGGAQTEFVTELQVFDLFSYDNVQANFNGEITPDNTRKQHYFVAVDENMGRRYAVKVYFKYESGAEMAKSEYFSYILSSLQVEFARGSPSSPFLTISNCASDPLPCNIHEDSAGLGLFIYLDQISSGTIYFSLILPLFIGFQPVSYQYGIGISDCGDDMCHGNQCKNIGDSPQTCHWCNCIRNHSGLDCLERSLPNTEYAFWVVLLVGSNSAMALAVWRAFLWMGTYAEGFVFAITMLTSGIYHLCDTEYYCFGAYAPNLRLCDFYMSYFSITVSLIYLARIQRQDVKFTFVLLYAIILVFCAVIWDFGSFWTEIFAPLSAAIVPIIAWGRFVSKSSRNEAGKWWNWRIAYRFLFTSGNFRWKFGITSLITFALAITSKELETNYNYWIVRPHADP